MNTMWQVHFTVAGAMLALASAALAQGADARQRALEALEADPHLQYSPTTLLVRFNEQFPAAHRADVRALVAGGLIREYPGMPGLELIEVGIPVEQAVAALRALPFVSYAEPDHILRTASTPNDPQLANLWGMHNIRALEAWTVATGSNFVIAVIDTGVQYTHADLAANIWTNPGEIAGNGADDDGNGYVDDVYGWDFYDNNNNPWDKNGHGTHVAGTIGAAGNNGIGVVGVNWQCRIMSLRFIGPRGGLTSDAIAAVQYAVNNGARISNNSWGGGAFSAPLRDTIAWAGSQGHLFIAAAGNNGRNNDSTAFYPASYNLANMINVAAIDSAGQLASFSNYGAGSVHLGAPGVSILSTYRNNGYAYADGTSMAAPHVSGAAALYWAMNSGTSMENVRQQILSSARPLGSLAGKTVTGGTLDAAVVMGLEPTGGGTNPGEPSAPPPVPTGVQAVALGGGEALVSWSHDNSKTDFLEVQRWKRQGNVWKDQVILGPIGGDQSSHTDAPGSGTFRYRVRAVNTIGASDWSPYVSVNVN
jgi:subtilisin family serine protease